MSTIPRILAERRAELARSLEAMEREIDEAESTLRDQRSTCLEMAAELRGIDAAIVAYTHPLPSNSGASLGLLTPRSEQDERYFYNLAAQQKGVEP